MKYPKLPDELNLSKKLTSEDIVEIREKYFQYIQNPRLTQTFIINNLAKEYKVSYSTIYYWVKDKYRKEKREKDNKYWNNIKKINYEKWYSHKKDELIRRRNRMNRNPELKLWHEVTSAKNEKRIKRKTVHKKKLNEY